MYVARDLGVGRRGGRRKPLRQVGLGSQIVAHPGAKPRVGEAVASSTRVQRRRIRESPADLLEPLVDRGIGRRRRRIALDLAEDQLAIDQPRRRRRRSASGTRRDVDQTKRERRPRVAQRDRLAADQRERAIDQFLVMPAGNRATGEPGTAASQQRDQEHASKRLPQ